MNAKQILEFVKVEHTLFSLPFVLIGFIIAHNQFAADLPTDSTWLSIDILWLLIAAIGARGLAMTLNRIIDRDIDAANPRTAARHLATGEMSTKTAYILSGIFLILLCYGAWQLHEVALKMAWLPVLAFVVYPYTKRFTWGCHLWLGLCLGLAPAAAWLALAAEVHYWDAILEPHWYPQVFWISMGVALWIAAFDINYARIDVESDRETGIHSFPARFGETVTTRTSVQLTLAWFACFAIADPISEVWFLGAAAVMAVANVIVILSRERLADFQTALFRVSMLTGWVLLAALLL